MNGIFRKTSNNSVSTKLKLIYEFEKCVDLLMYRRKL